MSLITSLSLDDSGSADVLSSVSAFDAGVFAQSMACDSRGEVQEIIDGLMLPAPMIAHKYMYDDRGSTLFEAVTRLPEYYLTRAEQSILTRHGDAIADYVGADAIVIELGAGNCEKARALCLRIHAAEYLGIDISFDHLQDAVAGLQANLPWMRSRAMYADITRPFALPDDLPRENRLVFFPGSSIGNFEPAEAVQLLTRMREMAGTVEEGGGVLIGFDLPKPAHVMQAAYDDGSGITAAFNRNALEHVNRIIGSDFEPGKWKHRAFYNAALVRMEMHLVALKPQRVRWPGGGRDFAAGERIHTENSYKYSLDMFVSLLRYAGFLQHRSWTDGQGRFVVIHAW